MSLIFPSIKTLRCLSYLVKPNGQKEKYRPRKASNSCTVFFLVCNIRFCRAFDCKTRLTHTNFNRRNVRCANGGVCILHRVCIPATKLRLDVAGDNMYYLGFLYTLSSLAVAITISEAEQILANFGVAISSTILGIAARVAFQSNAYRPSRY